MSGWSANGKHIYREADGRPFGEQIGVMLTPEMAQLAAASPDLYEALSEAEELLSHYAKRNDPEWDGSAQPQSVIGKSRTALAKARGETPPQPRDLSSVRALSETNDETGKRR